MTHPKKPKSSLKINEVRKRLRETYWNKSRIKDPRKRPTLGEDLRRHILKRKKIQLATPKEIEIWLAFFDEVIAFWLLVWMLYKDRVFAAKKPVSNQLVCLMTLAGRIFQDLICVRDLIAAGFYVQSNVVARSLIESIDVMHLLQLEALHANEFRAVETNEQASLFWHRHCSRNKIHKKIHERWKWFFQEDNTDAAAVFHSQRENYLDLIGMSAHPTFPASFTTFMDGFGRDEGGIANQALGSVSPMSKFTLHLIFLRIFEYGILWVGPDAGLYRGASDTKWNRSKQKDISKYLSMVFSIVVTVNDNQESSDLFPEFETYWPRPRRDSSESHT